jgi:hypothetical protein
MNKEQENLLNNFLLKKVEYQSKLEEYISRQKNIPELKLRFDIESVEILEQFYYDSVKNKKYPANILDYLQQCVWMFLGEMVISKLGGGWEICDLRQDSAYNTPIINNWGDQTKDHVTISPKDWETIMFKYNNPKAFSKYIKRIIENPQ